jgi:hypothetical protein
MSTDFGSPPPEAPRPAKTNTLAIISLVCGILSFPLICCWPIGIPIGIAAVALGFVAQNQITKTREGGGVLATAGIVLGAIMVVVTIILLIVGVTVDPQALQRQLEQQQGIEQPGGPDNPGELEFDLGPPEETAPAPQDE